MDLGLGRISNVNQLPRPPCEAKLREKAYWKMIDTQYRGVEPWYFRQRNYEPSYAEDFVHFEDRKFGEPDPSIGIRLKRTLANFLTAVFSPVDSIRASGRLLFANFCGCCTEYGKGPRIFVYGPQDPRAGDNFGRVSPPHETPNDSIARSERSYAHLKTAHDINRSRHLLKPPKPSRWHDSEDIELALRRDAPRPSNNCSQVQDKAIQGGEADVGTIDDSDNGDEPAAVENVQHDIGPGPPADLSQIHTRSVNNQACGTPESANGQRIRFADENNNETQLMERRHEYTRQEPVPPSLVNLLRMYTQGGNVGWSETPQSVDKTHIGFADIIDDETQSLGPQQESATSEDRHSIPSLHFARDW